MKNSRELTKDEVHLENGERIGVKHAMFAPRDHASLILGREAR